MITSQVLSDSAAQLIITLAPPVITARLAAAAATAYWTAIITLLSTNNNALSIAPYGTSQALAAIRSVIKRESFKSRFKN